jgi:predicted TIM-barrel fold metal-dependent hydrolase
MDDRLVIVSADSHAGMPPALWKEYFDPRFHDLLPQLAADNELYTTAITVLSARRGSTSNPDFEEAHRSGWHGLHDPVLRLADMDREGIASEVVFHADHRLGDLFHNAPNRTVPFEVWHAGAQAWNRWAHDTFGIAPDRFHLTAAIGPCDDIDAAVAELEWAAGHGFVATYVPGYLTHPQLPPLFDPYWQPFWSACEATGLVGVVHAGFGTPQGMLLTQMETIYYAAASAAGSTDLTDLLAHTDAVPEESIRFFTDFLNHNVDSRRPLWQMTLGGVFDRHPDLKLMLSEIRLDWMPATFTHLDGVFDEHRADLPARRRPSEYWPEHCLTGASFIHKAEVGMRHEVGVDTIAFGRDYPHPEGTWPDTTLWLQDAFFGVPEAELRAMLGENVIRFFGLDRARLADLASRIGPTVDSVNGTVTDIPPEVAATFEMRGYYKPIEGAERIPMIEPLLREDLARVVG